MVDPALVIAVVVTIASTVGFALNEWTGGQVSDAMGLGHHHIFVRPGGMPHVHAACEACPSGFSEAGA